MTLMELYSIADQTGRYKSAMAVILTLVDAYDRGQPQLDRASLAETLQLDRTNISRVTSELAEAGVIDRTNTRPALYALNADVLEAFGRR